MTKYTVSFRGRNKGASGIMYPITEDIECEPSDLFRLLYDKYEHISLPDIYVDGRMLTDTEVDQIYDLTNWSKQ